MDFSTMSAVCGESLLIFMLMCFCVCQPSQLGSELLHELQPSESADSCLKEFVKDIRSQEDMWGQTPVTDLMRSTSHINTQETLLL